MGYGDQRSVGVMGGAIGMQAAPPRPHGFDELGAGALGARIHLRKATEAKMSVAFTKFHKPMVYYPTQLFYSFKKPKKHYVFPAAPKSKMGPPNDFTNIFWGAFPTLMKEGLRVETYNLSKM